jgi:hypothetical protein
VGTSGREKRVNGQVKGGWIWSVCFIYLQENRAMIPTEIILSRREAVRENDGGNLTKVYRKILR